MPLSASCPPPRTAMTPDLEAAAARYAALARGDAEALIDDLIAAAVREWRVADATFWQRVKFRSRMIRTVRIHKDPILHPGKA